MDNTRVIEDLRRLPDATPALIKLARECVKDGKLDVELLAFRMEELETATREAQAYVNSTTEAISCLRALIRSSS